MHFSIIVSILLGAGALAFPQRKHAHLHEKKDVRLYSQWQDGPHTLIQEFINDNVVGESPPPASTTAVIDVNENYAFPQASHNSWAGEHQKAYQNQAVTVTPTTVPSQTPSPSITSPAVSSTPSAAAVVQASPVDSTPASSSPAAGSSGSGTTSGACNPTDGDSWSSPPCTGSSGASALDKINNLRKTWNSSLADYKWDSTLAKNAHDTAWLATTWTEGTDSNGNPTYTPNGEGRGWVMGHHLFPGSNGQCIAEGDNTKSVGDLTPIETMFLMWICEKPSSGIQDMCTAIGSTSGDPNCYCADIEQNCSCGHAMIIESVGLNSIGCYFMDKVATGKTDNAVNAQELAQELGTKGNSAPGMLTCDFTG